MESGLQSSKLTSKCYHYTMSKSPLVTVILPCYNESNNLRRGVLTTIYRYLSSQDYGWEVLISDDGSTDNSRTLIANFAAKHPGFRLLPNPHSGKPFALHSAIKEASGQYVLFSDMDQSTPIDELDKLLPWIEDGYKVVIGSRGARREDAAFYRQLASILFLAARRLIVLPEIIDTQCGFKLVETKLARRIFANLRILGRGTQASGWKVTAYDVEMLFLAKKLGEKIQEVSVIWRDEDTSVGKKRNFLKESYEMFFEILRVRVNDFLGKYQL